MSWEREGVIQYLRGTDHPSAVMDFLRRKVTWSNSPVHEWSSRELEVLCLICLGVQSPQFGGDWAPDWERRDAKNLWEGVILAVRYPQFANRDCGSCRKWWYNDDTGKIVTRGKRPLLRPSNTVLRCETPAGCPKGIPTQTRSLSPKNKLAWRHYLMCRATGRFPDDPIVQINAMRINKALRHAAKLSRQERS